MRPERIPGPHVDILEKQLMLCIVGNLDPPFGDRHIDDRAVLDPARQGQRTHVLEQFICKISAVAHDDYAAAGEMSSWMMLLRGEQGLRDQEALPGAARLSGEGDAPVWFGAEEEPLGLEPNPLLAERKRFEYRRSRDPVAMPGGVD